MPAKQGWRKRHAIQIVAQLPENTQDALMVLDLARELVERFLVDAQPARPMEVALFPASVNSR